jgi:hypothetical protein
MILPQNDSAILLLLLLLIREDPPDPPNPRSLWRNAPACKPCLSPL